MRTITMLCGLLAMFGTAVGEEPSYSAPAAQGPTVCGVSAPAHDINPPCTIAAAPCCTRGCPAACPQLDKSEHLTAAARHLDLAGLKDEAAKLRAQAQREAVAAAAAKRALLRKKESELATLEKEVGQLRARLPENRQVLAHFKILEINRTGLRDLGFDFQSKTAFAVVGNTALGPLIAETPTPTNDRLELGILPEGSSALATIEALKKHKLVKILAEPTVVTVSGRPAYFFSGGEIPIPIPNRDADGKVKFEFHKFGTEVDLNPTVFVDGTIRAEVKLKQTNVIGSTTLDGHQFPQFAVRAIDTDIEAMSGQTVVIGGLVHQEAKPVSRPLDAQRTAHSEPIAEGGKVATRHKTEVVFLIRLELAEPMHSGALPVKRPSPQARLQSLKQPAQR